MFRQEYLVTERPHRRPTHPGEILREDVLPGLDISITAASRELRVSRQTLHRILNGTHPVTPSMALRLGRFCGNGPDVWLAMQQAYDLYKARIELKEELQKIPVHSLHI